MELTRTAYGTWSGGRYMHFGEMLDVDGYTGAIQGAYEAGIRTFVTADVYGGGEADKMLGKALAGVPRESYCLVGAIGHDFYEGQRQGSKGYPRFTDGSLRAESGYAGYVKMATEKSLERCGVASFDLLMLHNPDYTGYTSPAVWEAMSAVKEEGLTGMLGVAPGPANGFTLDVIGCMERFGDAIDWAMLILNPLEPWPGSLALPAAEKHGVKVLTRVVDYGGLFHDDVRPGHPFSPGDHRTYRPEGWVEAGYEKVEALRPIAERHGLTMLQFACAWTLAQPAVECVVPTIIQEPGEGAKAFGEKVRELAELPEAVEFSDKELVEVAAIGDNTGCMALKGGSANHEGERVADRWEVTPDLEVIGERWGIRAERDLAQTM